MDNALEANDREQSTGDSSSGNGAQNDETDQASSIAARLALEEEVAAGALGVGRHVERGYGCCC